MTVHLKGGYTVEDPRLGRLPEFDVRSRSFPIRTLIADVPLRPKRWRLVERLDQGREGACFPAGTLIEMADGSHKPIEAVRTLERVKTAECGWSVVLQTHARFHADGLIRVRLRGHQHLRCTAEHPILTRRGYVPAGELTIGDQVRLPVSRPRLRHLQAVGEVRTADWVGEHERRIMPKTTRWTGVEGRAAATSVITALPEKIALTERFGRIVGLWLAEGSTTANKVVWTFGEHERYTLVAELIDLLHDELGVEARLQVRTHGAHNVIVYGKHWRMLFERMLSLGPYDKHLPGPLASGPREFLEAVLEGWLAGDGYRRRGTWTGVTVSHALAMTMFRIAQGLGKAPVIRYTTGKPTGAVRTRRGRWDVEFSDGDPHAEVDEDGVWRKVVGLDHEEFAGHVFNLYVEHDNSYVAEGIGVHNCVGFGWAHELAATPVRVPMTNEKAHVIYRRAQQLDQWAGENYSGTSVLAGAKAVKEFGRILEYRWAFSVHDVLSTLSLFGPVVVGLPWFERMFNTNEQGFLQVGGEMVGGHCVCLRGLDRDRNGWFVVARNSWGRDWGVEGDFKLRAQDLGQLLARDGDACVPVVRR